jgi:hypothetical protein
MREEDATGAIVSLLGRWNWRLPGWADTLPRVPPASPASASPAAAERRSGHAHHGG